MPDSNDRSRRTDGASIAGSVMTGYAQMRVELKYLLAASFMAVPGSLLFAKLIMPETERTEERFEKAQVEAAENVLDAAGQGASSGLKLALKVGALLLAFIALIALMNMGISEVGRWFGDPGLTLQKILGSLFAPLAWLVSVPWAEATAGGSFIGQKLILNEFVACAGLVEIQEELTPLSRGVITFALCGFANLSSIAILLGGLGGVVPSRRAEIARLGLWAVVAASLANLMSAAIAGFFLPFIL
ncbi:MAG: hypothetical protein GWO24_29970 [Akkermansiaceae bacterium]|nr:hypothetical protein [Akkermansiaceae bacterium]